MKLKAFKQNRGGFTLSETMMALLILLMVSSIVVTGLPAAVSALHNAVDASHAQVLLSTTMTSLRDELSMAKNITWDDSENKITYVDSNGVKSELRALGDGEGDAHVDGIYLKKVASPSGAGTVLTSFGRLLVSDKAATAGLYATFSGMTLEDGIVKIEQLRVCRKVDGVETKISDLGDLTFEIEVIGRKG